MSEPTVEERLASLEQRFAASERRHAEQVEHIALQLARMQDRFNQRQDTLVRELSERIDAVARNGGGPDQ